MTNNVNVTHRTHLGRLFQYNFKTSRDLSETPLFPSKGSGIRLGTTEKMKVIKKIRGWYINTTITWFLVGLT